MITPLDKRHLQPEMGQVFRHLQTDETAADHDRTLGRHHRLESCVFVHAGGKCCVSFYPFTDCPDIGHGAHTKDAW